MILNSPTPVFTLAIAACLLLIPIEGFDPLVVVILTIFGYGALSRGHQRKNRIPHSSSSKGNRCP